jgi:hypothetical protein
MGVELIVVGFHPGFRFCHIKQGQGPRNLAVAPMVLEKNMGEFIKAD